MVLPVVANETEEPALLDVYDLKVEDGKIVFESWDQMVAAREILSNSQNFNTNAFETWESTLGFKSYETKIEKLLKQHDATVHTLEAHEAFANRHQDILEADEFWFTAATVDNFSLKIIDENGMFRINNSLVYMGKEHIVILDENNPEKMEQVKTLTESNLDLGVEVGTISYDPNARGACGTWVVQLDQNETNMMLGLTKTRRSKICSTQFDDCEVRVHIEADVWSLLRKDRDEPWKRNYDKFTWGTSWDVLCNGVTYSGGTGWTTDNNWRAEYNKEIGSQFGLDYIYSPTAYPASYTKVGFTCNQPATGLGWNHYCN